MIARAWRTPLGATITSAMQRMFAGERAAVTDARIGYACTTIAPLFGEPTVTRQGRFLGRMGLFGLDVAREAFAASGLAAGPRIGVFCGVGGLRAHWDDMMAQFATQTPSGEAMWERGLREVHPYWMLRHLSNNVHALASAALGLRGEGAVFGGGNGGAQAIAAANRALWAGAIDAALVIAYDSLLEPETLVELGVRGSATTAPVAAVTSPYDRDAAGFVPGEAAAAIVLVRDATAPLAWLDVREGTDLARCMRDWGDADVVAGIGQARPALDHAERTLASTLVATTTPLIAPSAAIGQLGAATSLVQAIVLAEALHAGTLPPIAGLAVAADSPLVPITTATPTRGRIGIALHTSVPSLAAAIRIEVP